MNQSPRITERICAVCKKNTVDVRQTYNRHISDYVDCEMPVCCECKKNFYGFDVRARQVGIDVIEFTEVAPGTEYIVNTPDVYGEVALAIPREIIENAGKMIRTGLESVIFSNNYRKMHGLPMIRRRWKN